MLPKPKPIIIIAQTVNSRLINLKNIGVKSKVSRGKAFIVINPLFISPKISVPVSVEKPLPNEIEFRLSDHWRFGNHSKLTINGTVRTDSHLLK